MLIKSKANNNLVISKTLKMREFRKISQSKRISNPKSDAWPEYEVTFDDGEVLNISVPTGVNYEPDKGDEINPFKNKRGTWQITDKGYRKGRGVIKQTSSATPTIDNAAVLEEKINNSPYVPDLFDVFSTILPVYAATISNRSNTGECDLAVSKCLDQARQVLAALTTGDESNSNKPNTSTKESSDAVADNYLDQNREEFPF